MVTSMSTCSANSKIQFAVLKVVNLYLFNAKYSSRQKLLDSNLESSTLVTRVTRHSPNTVQMSSDGYNDVAPM